ncbi:hypothetical protein SVIOM74S_02524 [Streptomyces violarus]
MSRLAEFATITTRPATASRVYPAYPAISPATAGTTDRPLTPAVIA